MRLAIYHEHNKSIMFHPACKPEVTNHIILIHHCYLHHHYHHYHHHYHHYHQLIFVKLDHNQDLKPAVQPVKSVNQGNVVYQLILMFLVSVIHIICSSLHSFHIHNSFSLHFF